jgi:hypothetical protein
MDMMMVMIIIIDSNCFPHRKTVVLEQSSVMEIILGALISNWYIAMAALRCAANLRNNSSANIAVSSAWPH